MAKPPFRSYSRSIWSEARGQKRSCYIKSRGGTDQRHAAKFGHVALQLIEHRVPILEPMFYSFESNRMKIGGVTVIRNNEIVIQQILKRRSTWRIHGGHEDSPKIYHTY